MRHGMFSLVTDAQRSSSASYIQGKLDGLGIGQASKCAQPPHYAQNEFCQKPRLPEPDPIAVIFPDPTRSKPSRPKKMKNTYCPIDPINTLTFQQVLKDHSDYALEILLMSYAIQDVVGEAMDKHGPSRFALSKKELEVALGCGVEAAAKCAEMSGLRQDEAGNWIANEGHLCRILKVKSDLLAKFTHRIADLI